MKKAFTLIELLVVVAIIGILSAIAIPIFQDSIKESKKAQLKQICSNVRSELISNLAYCSINPSGELPEIPNLASAVPCNYGTWYIGRYVYQIHGKEKWIPDNWVNTSDPHVVGFYPPFTSSGTTPGHYFNNAWIGNSSTDAVGIRVVKSYYINNKPNPLPDYIELSCKDMFNAPYAIKMQKIYSP
jgi:prepilin-type N-terminal cleavage/methylation domain-containing protein